MNDFEAAKQHFMGGLQLLAGNDIRGAESEFTRSLELLPDRVSTLNNLAAIKIKQNQFVEAEKFARRAIASENSSTEAWANLAVALAQTERRDEALRACDCALQHDSFYSRAWLIKASVLLEMQQPEKALAACEQALKLEPGTYDLLYLKSQVLKALGQQAEAKNVYMQSFEARVAVSPVLLTERRPTQKADVLIITLNPNFNDDLKPFETLLADCPNYPGQLTSHMGDDIHFTYVFVGDAARESAHPQIPRAEVVINNCANAELLVSEGDVEALSSLVETFKAPVVNHPKKILASIRDTQAKSLEGLPGVLVPKTLRFTRAGKSHEETAREIEAEFDYPLITRTINRQMGKGMNLVRSRENLFEVLGNEGLEGVEENFFVTKFYDTRGSTNLYRKLRAAVVGNDIILMRVDFSDHWNVHGRKSPERARFYLDRPHLLEAEQRICQDPAGELGRPVMQALQAIREKLPMDIFGIDFDIDHDDRVIFYEANATMNLFCTAFAVPNPKIGEDRLKEAFIRYLTSLAKRN